MISLIAMVKSGFVWFILTYMVIGMAVGLARHRLTGCFDGKALPV